MTEARIPLNLGDLAPAGTPPDKVAVIDLRDPQQPCFLTYAEMDAMVRGVARRLVAQAYPRGTRIGILALNSAEYVATYFGIMRAGLVAVPVNIKLPAEAVGYILQDAGVALVFADAARAPLVPTETPVITFDDDSPSGFRAQFDHGPFETFIPGPDDLAQHLYTSGSTGRPKGVPLTHDSQAWALRARANIPNAASERFIVAAPLFHMNGLFSTKLAFCLGASLVMLPSFTPCSFIQAVADHKVTALTSVPTMMARVLKETDLLASLDLSSVRRITMGSAPITVALWDRVQTAFPGIPISNSYGTTEAGPAVFGPHPDGLPLPKLSFGAALPGGGVKLVDGPDENQGVLWMRNPSVMTAYHNRPEQTAKVLHDGWYNSNDVMRRDRDGFYFFVGRADDMFVCSGENIYPGEVEKMLESHPAIHAAAVVPLPDEERGEMPVAFVVCRADQSLDYRQVKDFALAHAVAFQHPRRVEFLDELPLAGTNKVDRAALTARARDNEQHSGWSS